jgi:ribosomal protein S6
LHAYELVYIARPTADDTALATLTEKLNNLIQTAGGELTARDD